VADALAKLGAKVIYAVRDVDRGRAAAASASGTTEVRRLDLADLSSIRAFATGWDEPVHLLINNAGISAKTLQHTTDGFELQFGTNHLGPFALTNLLLPHITGRVITVASQAERTARLDLDDLTWQHTPYRGSRAYANTKLANLLFTSELQRRLRATGSAVRAMAAHPGFVDTNIYAGSTSMLARTAVKLLAQDATGGSQPVLYAALGDIAGDSFTGPRHLAHMRGGAELIKRSKTARDPDLARQLWTASEKLTGVRFPA
jgi:NAD(P)-dependent dehydrogenase (short-subunit alcohol dehydrogenase family)